MSLKIRNQSIFTKDGIFLKNIFCPKNLNLNELTKTSNHQLHCEKCNEAVLNTDALSESEIIFALKNDPNLCLLINLSNPAFEVEDYAGFEDEKKPYNEF